MTIIFGIVLLAAVLALILWQAHNKCCPDVTSTYLLRVRVIDAQHIIDMKEAHRDKGVAVSKK